MKLYYENNNISNIFDYDIDVKLNFTIKDTVVAEDVILTNNDFELYISTDNNGNVLIENEKDAIKRIDNYLNNIMTIIINKVIKGNNYANLYYYIGEDYPSKKNKITSKIKSWSHYFDIISKLQDVYKLSDFEQSCFSYRLRTSNHLTAKETNDLCKGKQIKINSIFIDNKELDIIIQQINRVTATHSNLIRYILRNPNSMNSVADIPNKYIRDINKYRIQ